MLKTKIKHMLQDFDLFECPVSFCIKENTQGFQSVFGGIISIGLCVVFLFLFIKNFITF